MGDGRMKDLEQQEKLELREQELNQEHWKYVDSNPELRQVLNDFMASVLLHRPEHVDFAREYFSAFKQTESESETPRLRSLQSRQPRRRRRCEDRHGVALRLQ